MVNSDSYVIDIGTGSGVLAMFAARAGARRVVALDINEESIAYARQAARLNGLADRIEFRTCHFEEFTSDERADVVICEMLSSMMLVEQQVPASRYIVRNILDKGGIILPQSATVYVVPVECPSIWQRFDVAGLAFPRVPQTVGPGDARDLADAAVLVEHDFTDPEASSVVERRIVFSIVDSGVVHGLVGFFESRLFGDISLEMNDGWRELFVPFTRPVKVEVGDQLVVTIKYVPGEYDSLELKLE